jgi:anaerobic selenocysteine-containing dehydrogenase
VKVESEEGAVEARVKVYAGAQPGVAAMPVGPGGAPGQAWRRAMPAQAAALVGTRHGAPGAGPAAGDAWVRIRRA